VDRPRWATVVGVIGLLVGGLGTLSGAQNIFMPQMLEMQKEMFESLSTPPTKSDATQPPMAFPPELAKTLERQFEVPEWFATWSQVNGIVGVLLSAGCIVGSILLLVVRPSGVSLFVVFSMGSLAWHGVRAVVAFQASSFMVMSAIGAAVLGIVIHGSLLLAVKLGDRSAYSSTAD
jgi:hypothetical protein